MRYREVNGRWPLMRAKPSSPSLDSAGGESGSDTGVMSKGSMGQEVKEAGV